MENDLTRTFGEIFANDIGKFRQQLCDIQKHQADRKKSEKWVERLRFLDISRMGQSKKRIIVPITSRGKDDGSSDYVAVSWRWIDHKQVATNGCTVETDYWIKRPDEKPHKSDFPDWYMERVILFAQSRDITKIWVGIECIYQKEGEKAKYENDKELGVQIMDIVYGESAASVGLLTTIFTRQKEIDFLAALLRRSIFVKAEEKEEPELKPAVSRGELLKVIEKVLSDPRWSRGWIFQEDHLASAKMTLLLPHCKHLKKDEDVFGCIAGELQVDLADFRQTVTLVCLACSQYGYQSRILKILEKVKQYNIWNKRVRMGTPNALATGHVNSYPTTTLSVIDDVCNRDLENQQDRVAIIANALRFSIRLGIGKNSKHLEPEQYSLSAVILALIILNGEIISNGNDLSSNIMQYTLQSYLKEQEYRFCAPNSKFEQSFIDRCRFKKPTITSRGIKTQGFLFELPPVGKPTGNGSRWNTLSFDRLDKTRVRKYSKDRTTHKDQRFNDLDHSAIKVVIQKLKLMRRGGRLADFLSDHLEAARENSSSELARSSTQYVLDMMSAISKALMDGCELRLGRYHHQRYSEEPTAIFIMPQAQNWANDNENDRRATLSGRTFPTTVFTSWDNGRGIYERETIASLAVSIFDEQGLRKTWDAKNKNCFLRSCGWVNEVWDFRGECMGTYTFPLVGITVVPKGRTNRKRVRSKDGYETGEKRRRY